MCVCSRVHGVAAADSLADSLTDSPQLTPWLEAQLREEWRVRKEDALMSPTGGLGGFISVAGFVVHSLRSIARLVGRPLNYTAVYAARGVSTAQTLVVRDEPDDSRLLDFLLVRSECWMGETPSPKERRRNWRIRAYRCTHETWCA